VQRLNLFRNMPYTVSVAAGASPLGDAEKQSELLLMAESRKNSRVRQE
jgi:hypothetical protein